MIKRLSEDLGQTMRKTTIHSHDPMSGHHTQQAPVYPTNTVCQGDNLCQDNLCQDNLIEQQWDEAIERCNRELSDIALRCELPDADWDGLFQELTDQLHRVEAYCRALETSLGNDTDTIRRKQAEFRQQTDPLFSRSYLMNRARTWPRGYPGDYEIIERVYNNQAVSPGVGQLLDRYFLASTLAQGIQQRREKMRTLLTEELQRRTAARVLNIGCGPCREVLELSPVIQQCNACFTNVDFDTDALLFSAQRLQHAALRDQIEFRQYNAIRMINTQKNIREFGRFDIIYTIGLLDYLSDDILVRLIRSLYATLQPGGVLIAVFKDCEQYDTEDYHWLVDWTGFLQRTAQESRQLLDKAGIPDEAVTVQRTSDGVMIFYRLLQTADTTIGSTLQGPHDRRQDISSPPQHVRLQRPDHNTLAFLAQQETPRRDP